MTRWAAAVVVLLMGLVTPASAAALPSGFAEVTLTSGLDRPTAVAFGPEGDGRMFIAEQAGRVKVRRADGTVVDLLDWSDRINAFGDRGLLGIAADRRPEPDGTLLLFLVFVADDDAVDDSGPHSSRLVRVAVTPDNELRPQATRTLVGGDADQGRCPTPDGDHATVSDAAWDCIPATATTHVIGTVAVDPRDGTIWFGSGDAEGIAFTLADRWSRMQTFSEESFAGKLLHVDRDGRGLPGHAFCPAVTDLHRVCTKIHAKGFRNPFRFTVGDVAGRPPLVADVGDQRREELNFAVAGGNYGWPCWEGSDVRPRTYAQWVGCGPFVSNPPFGAGAPGGTPRDVLGPAFEYDHGTGDAAVLAGPVYRGDGYPAGYDGSLFFGDYARATIRRFPADPRTGEPTMSPSQIGDVTDADSSIAFTDRAAFTQLTVAPGGDLVAVDHVTGADFSGPGRVVRFVYGTGNRPPVAAARVGREEVDPGEPVRFDATTSHDPELDAITYAWDFDGDGETDSSDPEPTHVYPDAGVVTARLTVRDARGGVDTATVAVLVGVHRPRVEITTPVDGSGYDAGREIAFAGRATDEDEPDGLPAAALRWEVLLVHGDHVHGVVDRAGVSSGSFTAAPDHGLDSEHRIRLVATDATGLQGAATVAIGPRPAVVRVNADPPGVALALDGQALVTPATRTLAVGLVTTLRAPASFTGGGVNWWFAGWSDGVAETERDYRVSGPEAEITARYVRERVGSGPGAGPAPAAGSTAAGPASGGQRRGAVRLRLQRPWVDRHRRASRITGTVDGDLSRPRVEVALARWAGAGCRWWSASARRFGRARSCAEPDWHTARLSRTPSGWRFVAPLGAELARRPGRLRARARQGGRIVADVTIPITTAR